MICLKEEETACDQSNQNECTFLKQKTTFIIMVIILGGYSSDSNRRGVGIEGGGCPYSPFFNRRRVLIKAGVHLDVIEVYSSEVVGHYLKTLFL